MKGFLAYIVLWSLGKRGMTGAELAEELRKRKGSKPSPGTIYPLLKEMKKAGIIESKSGKSYSLTKKGRLELGTACGSFCSIFYDMNEMGCFLKRHHQALKTAHKK